MAHLLFYHSQPLPPSQVELLKTLDQDFPDAPASAASFYAHGRGLLRHSERTNSAEMKRRRINEGKRWLVAALQHPQLTPHRRDKAEAILREHNP
jgi:hypothetical protein